MTAMHSSNCAATSRARHVPTDACNATREQVVLKLKTAWRDGTKQIVMSPPEFM